MFEALLQLAVALPDSVAIDAAFGKACERDVSPLWRGMVPPAAGNESNSLFICDVTKDEVSAKKTNLGASEREREIDRQIDR